MMKSLVAALAVLLIPVAASAQTETAPVPEPVTPPPASAFAASQLIAADLQLALPVGNLSDGAGIGIGALVRYERTVMAKLAVTGRLGLIYHLPKDVGAVSVKFYTIPILVGAKYDLTDAIYGAVELGLFSNHVSASSGGLSASNSETDFGITLGGGYRLDKLDLRLALHILDLSNAGDSMEIVGGVGYAFWQG